MFKLNIKLLLLLSYTQPCYFYSVLIVNGKKLFGYIKCLVDEKPAKYLFTMCTLFEMRREKKRFKFEFALLQCSITENDIVICLGQSLIKTFTFTKVCLLPSCTLSAFIWFWIKKIFHFATSLLSCAACQFCSCTNKVLMSLSLIKEVSFPYLHYKSISFLNLDFH